ncbi:MAG: hypothetical protein IJ401_06650 [Oscillospiraceae bacterium]|nr:hypothetical protein [Oscillospiraceae bacterium]
MRLSHLKKDLFFMTTAISAKKLQVAGHLIPMTHFHLQYVHTQTTKSALTDTTLHLSSVSVQHSHII